MNKQKRIFDFVIGAGFWLALGIFMYFEQPPGGWAVLFEDYRSIMVFFFPISPWGFTFWAGLACFMTALLIR